MSIYVDGVQFSLSHSASIDLLGHVHAWDICQSEKWQLSNDKWLSGFGTTLNDCMAPSALSKKQRPKLPTNVCKVRAVKDAMLLIAHCMCIAQRAPAQLPGESLALQACLAQQAGNRSPSKTASITSAWKEAWSTSNYGSKRNWPGQKNPCKVCAQLGPLGWSCPWGYMQKILFAMLILHICLDTQ